ncbi:hypothetical protein [Cysteiniphilum marinum]|uniref:hypothetical protein n=1 Tax=Cysteiniphilum marinum TaxID=2774191 RepID=UPI00193C4E40|nr:hypothetical protein [Cysteiniphilum marinum]
MTINKNIITLFFSLSTTIGYSLCNHQVVDIDDRFACVMVQNEFNRNIFSSSMIGGFELLVGEKEESMLTLGTIGQNLQITPTPYYHGQDKKLICNFKIKDARDNKITVIYLTSDSFEVIPNDFSEYCYLKD